METTNFIEFKKTRDLGTIITDSFKFIRENWKGYFGTIVRIAGPVFIVFIIAVAMYMRSLKGMVAGLSVNQGAASPQFGAELVVYVFLAMFTGLALLVLMEMSSLYFIKSYINNKGVVDRNEIITNVKQNFLKFLGFGFLMGLIVFFGTILCFAPGIYVGIALSLGASILVFENRSVGDTISYCFTLIKDHWWETFGVVIVVGLLVWVLGQIFGIPAVIYNFVKMGISASNDDPTAFLEIFSDPIYLILMVISYGGQLLLKSISSIASVFIYYDLNEQKNLTGTIEKIDSLGSNI